MLIPRVNLWVVLLNNQNIKLNITGVYNAKQTEKILKLINKKTKVIISIFAGRAGDVGKDPVPEFVKSLRMAKRFKNVDIFKASDTMVDSLTQLIARKRDKNNN